MLSGESAKEILMPFWEGTKFFVEVSAMLALGTVGAMVFYAIKGVWYFWPFFAASLGTIAVLGFEVEPNGTPYQRVLLAVSMFLGFAAEAWWIIINSEYRKWMEENDVSMPDFWVKWRRFIHGESE